MFGFNCVIFLELILVFVTDFLFPCMCPGAVRNHRVACEEEEEEHYVNFTPVQYKERQRKPTRALMDEDRDKEKERKEEESAEYEGEQNHGDLPEIHGGQEDIYETF